MTSTPVELERYFGGWPLVRIPSENGQHSTGDSHPSALLAEIEQGKEVVIARDGTPVAKLVRVTPPHAIQPGALHDIPEWRGFVYDRAIFAPMTDAELATEGWE